jgi:hypothetical protein
MFTIMPIILICEVCGMQQGHYQKMCNTCQCEHLLTEYNISTVYLPGSVQPVDCRYPAYFPIGSSASLCIAGIANSCGTCCGSLVFGSGCSVEGLSFRWWPWLMPVGTLKTAGVL